MGGTQPCAVQNLRGVGGLPPMRRLNCYRVILLCRSARFAPIELERKCAGSVEELTAKAGDELDEIGLSGRAGLLEEAAEVGLDGGLGDTERLGNFGNAAYFDDCKQNAQFGRRKLISLGDRLGRQRRVKPGLVHEQGSDGLVARTSPLARARSKRQHMGSVLLAVTCSERYDDALDPARPLPLPRRPQYV